ncbi:MAG: protein kinase [Gammaproteobacteria bacterium]|nr:protein kinase [Gammaproteobacteria bacterium]
MGKNIDIKIEGYRIDRVLGKGGMATVYLATQMSLGRSVALKVLDDPDTPQFFERFFNEGRFIARLNHSNLVNIYDIGQGEGFYYIAMEYLPGGSLKTQMTHGVETRKALKLLGKMAGCLGYVHSQGVVHRDIKPSNILFRADGTPVLTDFGIAKLIQTDNDLTVTGTIMGSPHYLSPEQAQGMRKLDGRSDIYSLGVILFEMISGRKPYAAESFAGTLMAHIREPIPRLPEEFAIYQPLVDQLMAKKPAERIQSGAELLKLIRQLATKIKQEGYVIERRAPVQPPLSSTTALLPADHTLMTTAEYNTLPGQGSASRHHPLWIAAGLIALITAGSISWQSFNNAKETPTEPATERTPSLIESTVEPVVVTTREQPKPSHKPVPKGPSKELLSWLDLADQRLINRQLSFPTRDSALYYYRKVLDEDPKNSRAQQGIKGIANHYAVLANRQYKMERYDKADRYIAQGLRIWPAHEQLRELKKDVKRKRNAPKPQTDIFDRLNPDD